MNLRLPLLAVIFSGVLLAPLHAADDALSSEPATPVPGTKNGVAPPPHPGLFNRIYHSLGVSKSKTDTLNQEKESKLPQWKHVVLTMTVDPLPLKLSETHQMKVTLRLQNKSGKLAQMEFPTGQRIEVVVKNPEGKMVEHWSEDQSFSAEPGVVTINPDERLEYTANLATRDLKVGTTYTIEGFFPSYETLRTSATVTAR